MDRFRNTRLWLYGLLSSVISGAAGAVAVMIVDPKDFNLYEGWHRLALVAAAMGAIAFGNYLQKHPLPDWNGIERRGRRRKAGDDGNNGSATGGVEQ